jgi:putative membrane protein
MLIFLFLTVIRFFQSSIPSPMKLISQLLIAFVALEHLYILYMEMFAWETLGKKTFKNALEEELFKPTKGLAANQGLYNGFLAAGLIWTFFICDQQWQTNIATFFLTCVIIAGIYGAYSASKKIFFVQALPALIALVFTFIVSCSDTCSPRF